MQWYTDLTESWLKQSILMLLSLLFRYSVTQGLSNFGLHLEVEKALDIYLSITFQMHAFLKVNFVVDMDCVWKCNFMI